MSPHSLAAFYCTGLIVLILVSAGTCPNAIQAPATPNSTERHVPIIQILSLSTVERGPDELRSATQPSAPESPRSAESHSPAASAHPYTQRARSRQPANSDGICGGPDPADGSC